MYGFYLGYRANIPCSAYLEFHTYQFAGGLPGLEFKGYGPAGMMGGHVYVNRNVNNISTTPVSNVRWNENRLEAMVYPNPATGHFYVKMQLPKSGIAHLQLFNMAGQEVADLYRGFMPAGVQSRDLKAGTIAPGVYFLRVTAGESARVVQVIVQ